MKRQLVVTTLLASLLAPGAVLARTHSATTPATLQASARPQAAPPIPGQQQPTSVRPQSRAARRSYERETRPRRHRGMSRNEKILLVGIAGSSMGIGAIAAGGTGVAIGAIVGGWGAFLGHHLYHWLR